MSTLTENIFKKSYALHTHRGKDQLRITEIYNRNFGGISSNLMADVTGIRKIMFNISILYIKKIHYKRK